MESDLSASSAAIRPMTAERQKIFDQALAQLRKTRAEMDPALLSRIRRIIAGNPEIMKMLGLKKMPKPVGAAPSEISSSKSFWRRKAQEIKAMSGKGGVKPQPAKPPKAQKPVYKELKPAPAREETVDQAKTMELMAKLMILNPDGKDKIKSVIKKAAK